MTICNFTILKIGLYYYVRNKAFVWSGKYLIDSFELSFIHIVIRYKVYNEQHPRAGRNTQHVLYGQQARAVQNT